METMTVTKDVIMAGALAGFIGMTPHFLYS